MRTLLRRVACVATCAASVAALAACASAQTLNREPPPVITVAEIKASPERFLNASIVVSGKLAAEGNYFSRNRRVFLEGADGARLDVVPWLPLSTPPAQSDTAKAPATLADFLEQNVELRGTLQRTPGDTTGAREPYRLTVSSAKVLPPKTP